MVEAYKIGFCPQCGTQIMVQDVNGRWNSFKPNFRTTKLVFNDGHYIKTNICASCLQDIDEDVVFEALTHDESPAFSSDKKKILKDKWSAENGN